MPALHNLIAKMNEDHDKAVKAIVGPLMTALDHAQRIRMNYTGEDKDVKEMYEECEDDLLYYLEAFDYYARRGTYTLPDHDGE